MIDCGTMRCPQNYRILVGIKIWSNPIPMHDLMFVNFAFADGVGKGNNSVMVVYDIPLKKGS